MKFPLLQQRFLLVGKVTIALLPLRLMRDQTHFDSGNLVFRTIGGPVGVVGGDDVRAGDRMVKRRVNDAGLNPIGDSCPQDNIPSSAGH